MQSTRKLTEVEIAALKARYGVVSVPKVATLCPERTFSEGVAEGQTWRDGRASFARIHHRLRRFERVRDAAEAAASVAPDSVAEARARAASIEATRKPKRVAVRAPSRRTVVASRRDIDADLRGMADGRRSAAEIARTLGVNAARVRARAAALGLPLKSTKGMGGAKASAARAREAEVCRLLDAGLSWRQVAAEAGIALTSVCRIVKRLRERGALPMPEVPDHAARAAEVARLTREGLSAAEIGKRLGVGMRAVQRLRGRAGVDGRGPREAKTAAREALIVARLAEGRSRAEIAAEAGISRKGLDTAIRRLSARGAIG